MNKKAIFLGVAIISASTMMFNFVGCGKDEPVPSLEVERPFKEVTDDSHLVITTSNKIWFVYDVQGDKIVSGKQYTVYDTEDLAKQAYDICKETLGEDNVKLDGCTLIANVPEADIAAADLASLKKAYKNNMIY